MRTGRRTRSSPRLIVLACLLAIAFGGLVSLIMHRNASAHDSTNVLLAAHRVERLVADMEAGQLRFVVTGDTRSLSPWHASRTAFPREAAALQRLAAEISPEQGRRAREIVRSATSYLREHAEPMVRDAKRNPRKARSLVTHAEGKRRIEAIRHQFDRFMEVQHGIAAARERDAVPASRRMIATAAGAAGSLLVIFLLVGYVMRGTVRRGVPETAIAQIPERASRERLARTVDEQVALRHVATLVARGASLAEVANAAAGEMGRVLGAEYAMVGRFDPDGTTAVAGHWSAPGTPEIMPPLDGRWPVEDETVADTVWRTARPARMPAGRPGVGPIGTWIRDHGIRQVIGCPVVADHDLWGMVTILSRAPAQPPAEPGPLRAGPAPPPAEPEPSAAEAEACMVEFARLVGLAVVHDRRSAELTASRVRLVEATDTIRLRIERELHDRAQQRLVTVGLELRAAEAAVPPGHERLQGQLAAMVREIAQIVENLQDIARRLHPAFLSKGGLEASLRALARRAAVPVEFDLDVGRRLPANVAVTVYHLVSEALANADAHAHASRVRVGVRTDATVRLTVRDDGIGGAWPQPGRSLSVLRDRVEALGGELEIESPPGEGTSLHATIFLT